MMWMLVIKASSHAAWLNNFLYHCSEKPGGGNVRNGAELKEMITTMTIGAIR